MSSHSLGPTQLTLYTIRSQNDSEQVGLQARSTPQDSSGLQLGPIPVSNPIPPVVLLPLEHRQRLRLLAEEAFPNGVPNPRTNVTLDFDPPVNHLPFIRVAQLTITNAYIANEAPHVVFENLICLWDTGASISVIPTEFLDPAIRDNRTEGFAIMGIMFPGIHFPLQSIIRFQPHATLPISGTLMFGQHGLLNRLQHLIRPALTLGPVWQEENPDAYGQIDLIVWFGSVPL